MYNIDSRTPPLLLPWREETIAKQLRCQDLSIACDLALHADSEEELVAKALQHILMVHGLDMSQPPMLDYLKAAMTSQGESLTTLRKERWHCHTPFVCLNVVDRSSRGRYVVRRP